MCVTEVPMTDFATAAEAARQAMASLVNISAAANGRSLTKAQSADYSRAFLAYNAFARKYDLPTWRNDRVWNEVDVRMVTDFFERGEDPSPEARIARYEAWEAANPDKVAAQRAIRQAHNDVEEREQRTQRGSVYTQTSGLLRDAVKRNAEDGTPFSFTVSSLPAAEWRALSTSANSNVSYTYADTVVRYERTLNPLLNIATIVDRPDGSPFVVPRLTADISAGTITTEGGGITLADPTFSAVTLAPFKYASMTQISNELAQDAFYPVEDFIAQQAGRSLGLAFGAHATTGTGTVQPFGFIGDAVVAGTAQGTAAGVGNAQWTFLDPAALSTLYFGIASQYRLNGSWLMSTDAFAKVLSWQDKNARPLVDVSSGIPTIYGRPIYESPAMATVGSASKSIAFGDFSRYYIVRTPLRVDISREYALNLDATVVRTVLRSDGRLVDTKAVGVIVSANT